MKIKDVNKSHTCETRNVSLKPGNNFLEFQKLEMLSAGHLVQTAGLAADAHNSMIDN